MPELAEVKIMSIVAKKFFSNCKLKNLEILYDKYKRKGMPKKYYDLKKALPLKILDFNTKGKFLWITLEDDWTIWIIPSMTGHLQPYQGLYSKIIFTTVKKGNFYFDDMRNFGQVFFCNQECDLSIKLGKLGPDILEENVPGDYLIQKLKRLKQTQFIGDVLLNQKVLAGVGNYIRADALYLSKISPFRKIKDLNSNEIRTLLRNIKKVIKESFQCQLRLALKRYDYYKLTRCYKFYVYGRLETNKGEIVEHQKMKNNRMIWWVPKIQK